MADDETNGCEFKSFPLQISTDLIFASLGSPPFRQRLRT